MELTIRKATADDAATAWDIRNAAIRHACKGFYAEELLELWTADEMTAEFVAFVAQTLYVATANDVIVGTAAVDLESGKLDAIFVRPDMMGKGIGKRLVVLCEELARGAGLTSLKLQATLNAAPFYRSCGFVGDAVGVYHSPRGITLDCVPMTKSLVGTVSTS
jgi:N-acetylglutamate synthase-like GNAT family acetyltransferase